MPFGKTKVKAGPQGMKSGAREKPAKAKPKPAKKKEQTVKPTVDKKVEVSRETAGGPPKLLEGVHQLLTDNAVVEIKVKQGNTTVTVYDKSARDGGQVFVGKTPFVR